MANCNVLTLSYRALTLTRSAVCLTLTMASNAKRRYSATLSAGLVSATMNKQDSLVGNHSGIARFRPEDWRRLGEKLELWR
jgi:hypothetical protein